MRGEERRGEERRGEEKNRKRQKNILIMQGLKRVFIVAEFTPFFIGVLLSYQAWPSSVGKESVRPI